MFQSRRAGPRLSAAPTVRRPLQRDQIASWHQAKFTNAPTEAAHHLIKRVKRIAFGFTAFGTTA
jgi:transposase